MVAKRISAVVGASAAVTDIVNQRQAVGSNLTAVELSGPTRIELAFALVLAAAATGLALGSGSRAPGHVRHRQRARSPPAPARRLRLGESIFVTGGGLILGAAMAAALSITLVDVLTGVFDPPPDVLSIPWGSLIAVAGAVIGTVVLAGASRYGRCAGRRSRSSATCSGGTPHRVLTCAARLAA